MAHVQRVGERPNVKYRARYIDPAGKERCRTFARKIDAEMFLTSIENAKLTGAYVDPAAGRVTLKQYGEEWRKGQAHLRGSSATSLEQALRVHVYPVLGARALGSIKASDIRSWQRGRLKPDGPLGPRTVYRIRGQLSALFKAAVEDRVIVRNPVAAVKAPKFEQDQVEPKTVEQIATLTEKTPQRYRAAISLGAGTGLRWGEAFGLTVDRIDFLRKRLRVDRQLVGRENGGAPIFGPPKSDAGVRVIPLADVTVKALAAHIQKYPPGPDGLVFTTNRGGAVTREVFAKAWRPAADEAGFTTGEGYHQLRHFYASLLIEAGRSVKEIQQRLGHKSAVETLDVYGHLWPDSEDGTREAVEKILNPPEDDLQPVRAESVIRPSLPAGRP